jgi:hypothetical protein
LGDFFLGGGFGFYFSFLILFFKVWSGFFLVVVLLWCLAVFCFDGLFCLCVIVASVCCGERLQQQQHLLLCVVGLSWFF